MADELTITFEPVTVAPVAPGLATDSEFAFRLRAQTRAGQEVASVLVGVTEFVATIALLDRLADRPDPREALKALLARWSVRRLERALADPVTRTELVGQPVRWWITDSGTGEIEELLALRIEDKSCRYQRADGPDLLCLAARQDDKTVIEAAIGTTGRHLVAPTSRPMCDGCAMPDAAVVCSQLSHPEVIATAAGTPSIGRQLQGALCNRGRDEVRKRPGDCRPGGHRCWQRSVRLEPAVPAAAGHPLILAEVLDSLDAWWRLGVVDTALLRLEGAASISGLTLPCASRSEFTDRLSALAAVLGSLRVGNDLVLPHLVEDEKLPRADHSVARLRICLRARIADADSLARANRALDRLRRLQRIRSTIQHPDSHDELVRNTAALGLAWPPTDWAAAWEQVRAEAVDAFRKLRDELRTLADRNRAIDSQGAEPKPSQ